MNKLVDKSTHALRPTTEGEQSRPTPTLVIGDVMRWKRMRRELPVIDGFVFIDIGDLTYELLESVQPQVILSPLLSRDFDAVEIARRLNDVGYLGRYRVVTDAVPDPDIIIKDIRSVAPNLDISLLNIPTSSINRSDD